MSWNVSTSIVQHYRCSVCGTSTEVKVDFEGEPPSGEQLRLMIDSRPVRIGWELSHGRSILCPHHSGLQPANSKAEMVRRLYCAGHQQAAIARHLDTVAQYVHEVLSRAGLLETAS